MNMIVNVDKNWGIGLNNKLLVSIPADMKFFRQTTTGNVVVMGRKTLESFPNGLPLKNRRNIVLTRDPEYKVKDAEIVHSREELMELLKDCDSSRVYVIGGESVYRMLLPDCDTVHVTKVDHALRRTPFSRIWTRCRSGKSRRTVRSRRISTWNIPSEIRKGVRRRRENGCIGIIRKQ